MCACSYSSFLPAYARNQYFIIISDYFSKYVILFPMRTVTAKSVFKCLEKHIFLAPVNFHSLIMVPYISWDFRDWVSKCAMAHVFYDPQYHLQTNLQAERANREIVHTIASCVRYGIRILMRSICAWILRFMKVLNLLHYLKSAFLIHGRNMITDGTFYNYREIIARYSIIYDDNYSFGKDVRELETIFHEIRHSLKASPSRNAKYCNLPVEFQVGQIIYKIRFPISKAINIRPLNYNWSMKIRNTY